MRTSRHTILSVKFSPRRHFIPGLDRYSSRQVPQSVNRAMNCAWLNNEVSMMPMYVSAHQSIVIISAPSRHKPRDHINQATSQKHSGASRISRNGQPMQWLLTKLVKAAHGRCSLIRCWWSDDILWERRKSQQVTGHELLKNLRPTRGSSRHHY